MTASVTDRLREYFDQNEVPYRLIEHSAAGSADDYHEVLGTRYEEQAKAVFLRHKGRAGRGFATLALQAHKRADLQRVANLLGAREVRLGTRDQLRETTGCDFGELPPIGRLFGITLLSTKICSSRTRSTSTRARSPSRWPPTRGRSTRSNRRFTTEGHRRGMLRSRDHASG
jgi:Ala-tRNA(Pro) deacylase